MHGNGRVLAAGLTPVQVSYTLVLKEGSGGVTYKGELRGNEATLRPMWLFPVVTLRLQDAHRLEISITELDGGTALFEAAEPDV